ncbi:unnamed protein product [Knipowitschia caucasica]
MSASVPCPPSFLPHVGEPPIPFATWRRMFENYMLVINATGDAWPDARKRAVLLHCLGPEGQRLFYTLPDQGDSMDSAMAALEKHFVPKVNVVACRHTFRQRVQRSDETAIQYVAALRDLAASCAFGTMEGEMIRDQLISNTYLSAVRDKLLLEDNLTLDKAVTVATQVEAAVKNATLLTANRHVPAAPIQAVGASRSFIRGRRDTNPAKTSAHDRTRQVSNASRQRKCFRCGSNKHLASDRTCPAASVQCNSCGKKGHFAKVCRSSTKTVNEIQDVVVPELAILRIDDVKLAAAAFDKLTCTVNIEAPKGNGHSLELIVDTGAAVSILPESIYRKYFGRCTLEDPKARLVTYSKGHLPVLGCLRAETTTTEQDSTVPATFYIVEAGSPLLGLDLIKALGVSIIDGKVILNTDCANTPPAGEPEGAVHNIDTTPVQTLGCVKGFIHKVQVNNAVRPVRQKLRRLPLSIRKEVSTELTRLLQAGIIERIDASEWVSPLVAGRKRQGALRLCVDLRESNKSVVMDCYPLPHMEDLFAELSGATYYSQIDLSSAYHQLPLHPESRKLTAFITHDGLFQFTRVPFGLASAPSAFQKMMETILKDLPGVQNYLDDIIIYGASREEHDLRLQAVLNRLSEASLQINFGKSTFAKTQITFLGHVISKEGLRPSTDHLTAIAEAPAPRDMPALRSFLGLTSWFSKFVPNYATLVEPLRLLLKTSPQAKLHWDNVANECFTKLKRLLLDSPALAMFNPKLSAVITTDASDYGLGAVLTQIHSDNTERIVLLLHAH